MLPNVLMIVDCSGSMLWAAYPNAYSNGTTYYGLFDPTKRYRYDTAGKYFVEDSVGPWSGNFLNWATLTRWDVEIYVLTGQRYVGVGSDRFLVSNPDNQYDESSFTDNHWYNDTDDVTPSDAGTSKLYRPVPFYYNASLTDNRWSYLEVYNGSSSEFFYLRIKVASDYEPRGLLHDLKDKVRYGLMHFNSDEGGYIQRYVKKLDAPHLANVIADLHRPLVNSTEFFTNYIPAGWTPLGETLYEATRYFRQVSPYYSSDDYLLATSSPEDQARDPFYFTEFAKKIWCAQNYVIIVTDGEATQDLNVPEYDDANPARALRDADKDNCDGDACPADQAGCGYEAFSCTAYPFDDTENFGSAYLDDVAYYAHHNDLRSDLAEDQTITTHTIFAFGSSTAPGAVLLSKTANNGGGMYKLATEASTLVDALKQIFEKITQQAAAAASTAITSEPLSGVDMIYIPYYKHPQDDQWWGNIRAFKLDTDGNLVNKNGVVATDDEPKDNILDTPVWDASDALRSMDKNSRKIFTSIADSKVDFDTSNANTVGTYFDVDLNGNNIDDESGEVNALISYIRGNDTPTGFSSLRGRMNNYLGDIMDAGPVFVGKPSARFDELYGDNSYREYFDDNSARRAVLYAATNDGMLHCFDASNGEERWAYIPSNLLPHLKWLANPNYCHVFYVDLSSRVWDIKIGTTWKSVLIGGMRLGGTPIGVDDDNDVGTANITLRSAFFALDVTNPDSPRVLWEKNAENFGYTYSRPFPVKVEDNWYLVIGSGPKTRAGEGGSTGDGYTDTHGSIFVVDPANGNIVRTISLGSEGVNNFFGSPVSVDYDLDYSVDMIYIGDAKGNLWRIKTFTVGADGKKIYATSPSSWAIDVTGSTSVSDPQPLLSLGPDQPILMKPEVSVDDKGRSWVYVGTGRYFCPNDNVCCGPGEQCPPDLVSGSCQSGYNVCSRTETIAGTSETRSYYMAVGIFDRHWDKDQKKYVLQNNTLTPLSDLNHRVIITGDVAGTGATGYAIVDDSYPSADIATDVCGTCDGWYFRLLEERERCLGDFMVTGETVFFITYKPATDLNNPCSTGGKSYLYGVYYTSGTSTAEPLFDVTGEGVINLGDQVVRGSKTFGPAIKRLDRAFAGGSPKIKGDNLYVPLTIKPEPINLPGSTPPTGVTLWKEVLQ